jgi:hypothetical protein
MKHSYTIAGLFSFSKKAAENQSAVMAMDARLGDNSFDLQRDGKAPERRKQKRSLLMSEQGPLLQAN